MHGGRVHNLPGYVHDRRVYKWEGYMHGGRVHNLPGYVHDRRVYKWEGYMHGGRVHNLPGYAPTYSVYSHFRHFYLTVSHVALFTSVNVTLIANDMAPISPLMSINFPPGKCQGIQNNMRKT